MYLDVNGVGMSDTTPNWSILKPRVEERKLFLGQLVLDNFHLFENDTTKGILGLEYWKQFHEEVKALVELDKKVAGK